jgi:hypothetical protein
VWDDQNLVHFVGHSAGACRLRVRYHMLADKETIIKSSNVAILNIVCSRSMKFELFDQTCSKIFIFIQKIV